MKNKSIYLSSVFKLMDENCGVPTDKLMENAAEALYGVLKLENRLDSGIFIVCGKGNNGGDGYALACLLKKRGHRVSLYAAQSPSSPLAVKYCMEYEGMGGVAAPVFETFLDGCETVVDCMFGFSFSGTLKGEYERLCLLINESGKYVLAADLPSGLWADTEKAPPLCIRADATCTFTAHKYATACMPAKAYCGKVYIADIGIPEAVLLSAPASGDTDGEELLKLLPKRSEDSHKGSYGPLAALCGNDDMYGAAYLACSAAYRTGTGLVRLYSSDRCKEAVKVMLPEVIGGTADSLEVVLDRKPKALLLGCGCGRTHDTLITELLKRTEAPTVLDADGINCIAGRIDLYRSVKAPMIITPHPAEMARLVGKTVAEVNAERIKTATEFASTYGFITVLKGNTTVVASPDGGLYVNQSGNNGLAKGGSGDVLAGIIASLLAQGVQPFDAAKLGVYLHGRAADALVKEKGVYAVMPSELGEQAGKIMYFG